MRRLAAMAGAIGAIVGLAAPAQAIVIDDAATAGYVTGTAAFTGVARIIYNDLEAGGGLSLCSGALLAGGMHVVTAGHCVDGGANWQVTFETPGGTATLSVLSAVLHPLYASRPAPLAHLNEYDVAILTLAGLAPVDAARYGIAGTLPPDGTPVDLVGYGLGGSPDGALAAGVRRHATNNIDAAVATYPNSAVPSPDLPLVMSTLFGGAGAGEGLISPGDSGGPALAGTDIVGIATTTTLLDVAGLDDGAFHYGTHANLTNAAIGDWLLGFIQVSAPRATVPFAAAAFFLLALSRRRRPLRSLS
ncbi:MAG: trypsin-like serine protease [Rhodospirillales bacterium]